MTSPDAVQSLQDRFFPDGMCFGCGPKNQLGLRIKSVVSGDEVIARFLPQPHHLAYEGMVNGGILGAILDCHSNWTAVHGFMVDRGIDWAPASVTAEFSVKLRRPTPMDCELIARARAASIDGDRAIIDAEIEAAGKITATCRGTFVAVRPGHPAYHRW
ncbi:MAG TPA: PaaI family thioesterase [Kofleriaceae bacterium]|nr:PaaI family thioesterase [Kofleriaceae bacterium]